MFYLNLNALTYFQHSQHKSLINSRTQPHIAKQIPSVRPSVSSAVLVTIFVSTVSAQRIQKSPVQASPVRISECYIAYKKPVCPRARTDWKYQQIFAVNCVRQYKPAAPFYMGHGTYERICEIGRCWRRRLVSMTTSQNLYLPEFIPFGRMAVRPNMICTNYTNASLILSSYRKRRRLWFKSCLITRHYLYFCVSTSNVYQYCSLSRNYTCSGCYVEIGTES